MDWKINGVTFAEAELGNVTLDLANMSVDRMTFDAPARDITAGPLFIFDAEVAITRDNAPFFKGRCGRISVRGRGHSIEILGPWDQLERLVFMQKWKTGAWNGDTWVSALEYKSRAVLGQNIDGTAIPAGRVIATVIDYAVECGLSIQIGAIDDGPQVPWDEISDMSCADVIRRMARWMPGAVGWFDYSVSRPKFNFRIATSIPATTLSVETAITSVDLTSVGARSVPAVVLIYEQVNDVNGASMSSTTRDVFPKGANGRELGAVVQTIALPGSSTSQTVQKQTIHCRNIPSESDLLPYRRWFLRHHPEWASPDGDLSFFDVTRFRNVKISKVTRQTTLPYELVEGTLQDWMRKYILDADGNKVFNTGRKYSFEDSEDVILTTLSYQIITYADDVVRVVREVKDHVVATKITATDCPSRTYKNESSEMSPGESPVTGLAEAIWRNLNANHYRGTIELAEYEYSGLVKLGSRLLISNGHPGWATMLAIVQQIHVSIDTGTSVVQVGPPDHLSVSDILDLRRANRMRQNAYDSDNRISGEATANIVELGSASPKGFGASAPGVWGERMEIITDVRFDSASNSLQAKKRYVVVDRMEDETDWTTIDGGQAEVCGDT